jgi:hypothetical protein
MNDGKYDPELVVKKWRDAYRRFYLYRPERVLEKMMFKENWTNLPNTLAQVKRFFIGSKDQTADAIGSSPQKQKALA